MELSDVERTAAGFPIAYLLTADGGRVHLLAVTPRFGEQRITVGGVGRHTAANVQGSGRVTLLWSPAAAGEYSLIVDGDATVDGAMVTVTPTKAILHRPAIDAAGARVGNDCVDVSAT